MGFFSSEEIEPELLNPEAMPYYRELMARGQLPATSFLQTAGQPYGGKFTADIGGLQSLGLKSLGEYLNTPLPTKGPLYGAATSELAKTLEGKEYDPTTGPYYSAYRGNVMRELQKAKDRLAARSSASDAFFGGGRFQQERELEEGAMGSLSQMLGQLYEGERARRLETIPTALQTMGWAENIPVSRAQAAYALDLPAILEQQRLDRLYQDYLRGRSELADVLGTQARFTEPVYYMPQYQPSEFSQLFGGGFGQSLGTGAGMALMGPMMACDERLKSNIKSINNALDKVGKLEGKTYNFKFNSVSERDAGVIAQDVEKIMPEAVRQINGVRFIKIDAMIGLLVSAIKELKEEMAYIKSAAIPDLN